MGMVGKYFNGASHPLKVISMRGQVEYRGRKYKVLNVETHDGLAYVAIRLYNAKGRFIKQFLFEPEIIDNVAAALKGQLNLNPPTSMAAMGVLQ